MDVVEGQDILISADVGWYYDNENWDFEYQGVTKKLSYHVMNIVDFVTIMDYTDNIDGAKSNISGEMDYAQDNDKDVVIAFETQEPKEGELELGNTFYEEGRHALTNTMDAVWAEYKEFNGFAIHYYDSYKDLQDYPLNGDQDDDDGTIPSVSTDGTPGFELILMVFAVVLFLFWKRKR